MVVKTCSLIPPFKNNPNEPSDPLKPRHLRKVQNGGHSTHLRSCRTITGLSFGAAMQKYLAGRSDREELIDSIQAYWDEQ